MKGVVSAAMAIRPGCPAAVIRYRCPAMAEEREVPGKTQQVWTGALLLSTRRKGLMKSVSGTR